MPTAYEGRYAATVLEYMRVAQAIEDQIRTGELRPGDKLPAEQALAADYGVAYSTARRAMKELRERGLIETVWGKGTFIIGEPEH
jgi:GntR family transcriptional regulator